MITEKTPTLYLKKMPSDLEPPNDKSVCSRTTISCVFALILVSLIVVVTIQFFSPVFNQRLGLTEGTIHLSNVEPIKVKILSSDSISKDKEPNAMNPWDFNFLIDPVELCITRNPPNSYEYQQDPEVKLLILVPSAVDHFDQRRAIRNTWGSIARRSQGPMRLGFVLGTVEDKTIEYLVQQESATFGDIIQADFVDSYHHLTTKSVLMLKWVAKRCPHAQYFLKADDDTFINVGVVGNILGSEPFISEDKFIGGYVHKGALPSRIPQEKYYISEDDYPFDEYPPYTSGAAYVMTGPTALELFDASKEVDPFLQQEDVFVTGLCANHIDAPRIHDSRFKFDNPPSPPTWDAFSSLASAHSVTPAVLETVWNDMAQSALETEHLSVLTLVLDQEAAINSNVLIRLKKRR